MVNVCTTLGNVRDLLVDDGSIWVSIDDNEGHYLKVLMDEVFGRNNFIATVVWQSRYSRCNDASLQFPITLFMYIPAILNYGKNPGTDCNAQKNKHLNTQIPIMTNEALGVPFLGMHPTFDLILPIQLLHQLVKFECLLRAGVVSNRDQWLEIVASGLAYFGKSGDDHQLLNNSLKDAPSIVPNTWWSMKKLEIQTRQEEGQALFDEANIFATPKPEQLMRRVIQIATNENDLVLDSFLGFRNNCRRCS